MISIQNMSNQANSANKLLNTSMERLSSGKQVNSAKDNAAGLAIIERLEARGRAFESGIANANNGISLLNIADSAVAGVSDSLQRLRELAVQSANGILSDSDRENLNAEANQLRSEISRLTQDTEFNGQKLLANNSTFNIQIGSGEAGKTTIRTSNLNAQLEYTGLSDISLATQASSQEAIAAIDSMISATTKTRADFGSQTNRLASSVNSLRDQSLSINQSKSQFQDADYAIEASNMVAASLKEQLAIALQSQANASSSQVLALLGIKKNS